MPHNLVGSSDVLIENILDAQGEIKKIGYKFQQWINIKGEFYNHSFRLWTKRFNKLLSLYASPSQWLKSMFILSHFDYGLEINNNSVWPWDSDGDINTNETYWNELNTPERFFSSKFLKSRESQLFKNTYCPHVTEDLTEWSQFCKDNDSTFHISVNKKTNLLLFSETAQLINKFLPSIPLSKESMNDSHFRLYLGKKPNEMFSSDPDYSIQKLSNPEKLQLSKTLIKMGLSLHELQIKQEEVSKLRKKQCEGFFPRRETNEGEALLYSSCYNSSQDLDQITEYCSDRFPNHEIDENESRVYKICHRSLNSPDESLTKISTRVLSAGIYLLKILVAQAQKDDLVKLTTLWPFTPPQRRSYLYQFILPLLNLLEVHKKGEIYFLIAKEALEANPDSFVNPHLFAKNLICGGDEESDDFIFSAPQFFSISEILIYNFDLNQYESMSVVCKKFANSSQGFSHDILFDRPVQSQGESYENLYLALENKLKTNYSSSKDLLKHFQTLSQSQWDRKENNLISNLELLTDNYYKNLINFDSNITWNHVEKLKAYYHLDYKPFTSLVFKGLEIPLFQVNYWMSTLKYLMSIGEQKFVKGENGEKITINQSLFGRNFFDKAAFEKTQMEVLSLLQSYHDTYKKEQGPYLLFADKELAEPYDGEKSLFVILQKQYSNPTLPPVLITPDIILSHILLSSIPTWSPGRIESFNDNVMPPHYTMSPDDKEFLQKSWGQLIYSVVSELNRSLNSFFIQLQPLRMKEDFENQIPRK